MKTIFNITFKVLPICQSLFKTSFLKGLTAPLIGTHFFIQVIIDIYNILVLGVQQNDSVFLYVAK